MKAIVCNAYGSLDDLAVTEVDDPVPQPGEVVVEQEIVGVNYPDGLLVKGLYQAKPALPFIPGIEVVGRIVGVGDDKDESLIGKRVAGVTQIGGYAERVCLHKNGIAPIPETIPADHMAAMLCGYSTAHHALKQRGNLQAGQTLVVSGGAGLTGMAAIQIGKAMGARVIALVSNETKANRARQSGADEVIGYDDLGPTIKAMTDNKGCNVAFDVVGGDVFEGLASAMAWEGRLLVIGFASGIIPKFPVNLALVKGYAVVGVFWGRFASLNPAHYAQNMGELLNWYGEGKISPHMGERFPLAHAGKALETILGRKAIGKITLELDK